MTSIRNFSPKFLLERGYRPPECDFLANGQERSVGWPGTIAQMDQNEITERNRIAWGAESYQAWVNHYGPPREAAAAILSDPQHTLRRLLEFVGDPKGLTIANPLGSHGRVATALALLGANVTVFDVSESNSRYARELAYEAGVSFDYVVGDFLATAIERSNQFDTVVMELGIVHYFIEIDRFVASVRGLLKPTGRLVLNEFHPLLKKSFDANSGKPIFKGDYFWTETEEAQTPYEIFVASEVPTCQVRRWNLGEIATAFASGRFRIERLLEHPSWEFDQLPGTFTLVATAD